MSPQKDMLSLCHKCLSAALAYHPDDDELVFCRACGSVVTDPVDARDAARCIAIADGLPYGPPEPSVEVDRDG